MIGNRFGRLTVVSDSKKRSKYKQIIWECQCDCGNITYVLSGNLRKGNTKSCGCLWRETIFKHGHSSQKYSSRTYNSWRGMKDRCYNSNLKIYKHYGGRGITVCKRWCKSFVSFLKDMGERPKGLTLDRIDNDGDYKPSNCRWTTWSKQMKNRRR